MAIRQRPVYETAFDSQVKRDVEDIDRVVQRFLARFSLNDTQMESSSSGKSRPVIKRSLSAHRSTLVDGSDSEDFERTRSKKHDENGKRKSPMSFLRLKRYNSISSPKQDKSSSDCLPFCHLNGSSRSNGIKKSATFGNSGRSFSMEENTKNHVSHTDFSPVSISGSSNRTPNGNVNGLANTNCTVGRNGNLVSSLNKNPEKVGNGTIPNTPNGGSSHCYSNGLSKSARNELNSPLRTIPQELTFDLPKKRKTYSFVNGTLLQSEDVRWSDIASCGTLHKSPSSKQFFSNTPWSLPKNGFNRTLNWGNNASEPAKFSGVSPHEPVASTSKQFMNCEDNICSPPLVHSPIGSVKPHSFNFGNSPEERNAVKEIPSSIAQDTKFEFLPKRPTTLRSNFCGSSPKRSRQGLALSFPTTSISEDVDISLPFKEQGWYHGTITRVEAENLLRSKKEGSYLVRNSDKQGYSISLKSARGFMHIKISCHHDGQFSIGSGKPFATIPSLVSHYSLTTLPVRGAEHVTLLHPLNEPFL